MKKRILSAILALCVLAGAVGVLPLGVSAADYDVFYDSGSKLYYKITSESEKTVEVTIHHEIGYTNSEYIIPSTVSYNNVTYTVTAIGDYAFCESNILSVSIPNTVVRIGDYAFYRCENIGSVNIPEGVTEIGDCAFYACAWLPSLTVPASVINIGDDAFVYSLNLDLTVLYDAQKVISSSAFFDGADSAPNRVRHVLAQPESVSCENVFGDIWNCSVANNIDLATGYNVGFYANGHQVGTYNVEKNVGGTLTSFNAADTLAELGPGVYTVRVQAVDGTGKLSGSDWCEGNTFTYGSDSTAPTVTNVEPSRNGIDSGVIEFTSTEKGTFFWSFADGTLSTTGQPVAVGKNSIALTLRSNEEAQNIKIAVKDYMGNMSSVTETTVPEWPNVAYVGGVLLNSETPYYVNGSTSASASPNYYNAYYNTANGTLTLKDLSITSGYSVDSETAGVYLPAGGDVVLFGTNTISGCDNGILSAYWLTVTGSGTLTVTAQNNGSGIHTLSERMTIYDTTLTVSGGRYGLRAANYMEIAGGSYTITGTQDAIYGHQTNGTVTIGRGTFILTSTASDGCGIYAANISLKCDSLTINSNGYGIYPAVGGKFVPYNGEQIVARAGTTDQYSDFNKTYTETTSFTSAEIKNYNHVFITMEEIPPTYTVTYDANGGTGTVSDSTEYPSGSSATLKDGVGLTAPTDKTFIGWNTEANGSGTSYSAGESIVLTDNITLYAVWKDLYHNHNEITYKTEWSGTKEITDTQENMNIVLTDTVTFTTTWQISNSSTVNICLNGHTLDMQGMQLVVASGNVNICDCSDEKTGKIIGDGTQPTVANTGGTLTLDGISVTNIGGTALMNNTGTLNLINGTIITTKDTDSDGIYAVAGTVNITDSKVVSYGQYAVYNKAIFTAKNSEIIGGVDTRDFAAYAVFNYGGTVTLEGTKITAEGESVIAINNTSEGTFTLKDSTVQHDGGGKYTILHYSGDFSIDGGTVNSKSQPITVSAGAKLYLYNSPVISTAFSADIYLRGTASITAHKKDDTTAKYTGDSLVIDYENAYPAAGTVVVTGSTDASKFSIEDTGYQVVADNGSLMLKITVTINGIESATGLVYNGLEQAGYIGTPANTDGYSGAYTVTYVGRNGTYYDSDIPPRKAGDYTVIISVPTSDLYYGGSKSLDFTIEKKQVTVTADSKTVDQGAALPSLTYKAEGLLGADTFTAPTLNTVENTNAYGQFDIIISGGTLANAEDYAIIYEKGTLTVNQRVFTVTFDVNGGNALAQNTAQTGYDGKLISLPTAGMDNNTFNGWFTEKSDGAKITADTVFTADTTVYAQWKEAAHTHSFEWKIDKEATETEDGIKHEECACGAKQNENTVIPKIGADNEPAEQGGLSTGEIVAIVISCTAVLAGGGFAVYIFIIKKKKP